MTKKVETKLFKTIFENMNIYEQKEAISIKYENAKVVSYRYSDLSRYTKIYSNILKQTGIVEGDRVALISENIPQWAFAFLAITKVNSTSVLIDGSLPEEEIIRLIKIADVRAILVSKNVYKKIEKLLDLNIPVLNLSKNLENFKDKFSKVPKDMPKTQDPDEEILSIVFSSGTTGTAKGVTVTCDDLVEKVEALIEAGEMNKDDTSLHVLPFYHIMGMTFLLVILYMGASLRLLETLNSNSLIENFAEYKPTCFGCVPRVYELFRQKILREIESKGKFTSVILNILLNISYIIRKTSKKNIAPKIFKPVHDVFGGRLRVLGSGGMSINKETAEFFYKMGFNIFSGYGMTETCVPITYNRIHDGGFGTNGKPAKNVELRIYCPDKKGVGEIQVKTNAFKKGYFRDEEATKNSYTNDGWFKTGDIGYFDKKGNLIITGRMKESIVFSNGKKVSPTDIEELYIPLEGVEDFVVCGVPVKSGDYDEVHAFVVLNNISQVSEEIVKNIIETKAMEFPQQFRIAKIHFVDKIPKTSIQKPKRYILKEKAKQAESNSNNNNNSNSNIPKRNKVSAVDTNNTIETLIEIVKKVNGAYNDNEIDINKNTRILEDLSFDSITVTEFCFEVEKSFGVDITAWIEPYISLTLIANKIDNVNKNEQLKNENTRNYKTNLYLDDFPAKKGVLEIFMFNLLRKISHICWKFEVKGLENLPKDTNYILCPNHETHLDGLWIASFLPKDHYEKFICMAKKEHLQNGFGRFMLGLLGGIPVDRSGNSWVAVNKCREELEKGSILLIHPEGTRTDNGEISKFKGGAIHLSLNTLKPIVPVRIKGGYEVFPKKSKLPKIFNFRKFRRYKIEILFGDPFIPNLDDIEYLTEVLRERVIGL